jgi:type IV pilus assembly protein PilO
MRNLGASPYLENPELVEIKAVPSPDKSGARVNEFNMNISIKRARADDGRGAPAKGARRRGARQARGEIMANLLEELKTLDPKQPGNWPWFAKIGAFVIIFILVQVAFFFLLWSDQKDQIEKGQQDVAKQKETFLEKKKLAVNLEAYKQQRAEIEQAFGALLKQLPNKSEMDALLIDINQAGLGRGLQFELFKPAVTENLTEFYAELPVAIKVTGNYHDLGAFASDVAKMPRIVLLTDLKVDPPNKEGLLSMEAVAKTYRYLDEEEVGKQKKAAKDKKAGAKPGGK